MDIQSMNVAQLKRERIRLEAEWDAYFTPDFEEHSGSPGEHIAEALNEINTRLEKLAKESK